MSKLTGPAFSLDARGGVGPELTYRQSKGVHIAQRIPTHSDAQSYAQLKQRWVFEDAHFYWNTLTELQKAGYRGGATAARIPLYAYFLQVYAATRPDCLIHLHLDTVTGGVTPDSSTKGNHGTVSGATPVTGVFSQALSFDGSDDKVDCGSAAMLDNMTELTYEAWLYPRSTTSFQFITGKKRIWFTQDSGLRRLVFQVLFTVLYAQAFSIELVTLNKWQHVAATWKLDEYPQLYINGVECTYSSRAINSGTRYNDETYPLRWADSGDGSYKGNNMLDEPSVYNRRLSAGQLLAHYQRKAQYHGY